MEFIRNLAIIGFVIFSIFLTSSVSCATDARPRYISLAPSTTEILFALGLDEEIMGVSSSCNYPDKARIREVFGTFSEPNIEKIVASKPDIVFATGLEQSQAVIRLEKLGLRVYVSDPKNINELLESIIHVGNLTHRQKEAEGLVNDMNRRIEQIKRRVQSRAENSKPKVFIEIWHDPLMTAGPGSIVNEVLHIAGARNIAFDAPRAYSRFSAEVVISRNPDVIILGYMGAAGSLDAVMARLGWKNIKAVQQNRVITDINPDLILRPGPRIVDGIEEVYRRLYNE